MFTVKFDDYDSSNDFGMILTSYTIAPATRKTNYVSIPGRNGDLDLSDYLGVAYEDRTITITFFKMLDKFSNLTDFQSNLETKLNGNRMKVIFSNDSNFYWDARISVDSINKLQGRAIEITITCNANPYKINVTTGEEVL